MVIILFICSVLSLFAIVYYQFFRLYSSKTRGLEQQQTHLFLLTDPHGFYSAHHHQKTYDADYPFISSFVDVLKQQAKNLDRCDVFFLENGDMVDGGGLTDEPGAKKKTFPILESIGFDARMIGNHELYQGNTLRDLEVMLPGPFVTSNVVRADTKKPFGKRYRILKRPNSEGSLLVFGFLYNMKGYDSSVAFVEQVASCVEADWFKSALLNEQFDSIVVLAHMDYKDPLVYVLLAALRQYHPRKPVVFVTGHTHQRRSLRLDPFAFSLEAGKYADTIGMVSFPSIVPEDASEITFNHLYLNTNIDELEQFAKIEIVESPKAINIRRRLREVRSEYDLDRIVGYNLKTLKATVGFDAPDSLVRFWIDRVIPATVLNKDVHCPGFFIGGSGSIRFDLFQGPVIVDDIWALAPFAEEYRVVRCIQGNTLLELIQSLPKKVLLSTTNSGDDAERWMQQQAQQQNHHDNLEAPRPFHPSLPPYVHSSLDHVSRHQPYDLIFGKYDAPAIMKILNEEAQTNPEKRVDEPFRVDEINQHNIWLNYFERKKTLNSDPDDDVNNGSTMGDKEEAVSKIDQWPRRDGDSSFTAKML